MQEQDRRRCVLEARYRKGYDTPCMNWLRLEGYEEEADRRAAETLEVVL